MSANKVGQNKFSFILLRGVLGWGVSTAIVFQLIMHFTGEKDFSDGLVSSLVTFPIAGIFFGYFLWKSKQNKSLEN